MDQPGLERLQPSRTSHLRNTSGYIHTATRLGWRCRKLRYLSDTGTTLIEVRLVADFPGRFGWGYDRVQIYAPASLNGRPDSMRTFVDRAHALGIGVILDVVYNHLRPDSNYLPQFSTSYFSQRHETDWGPALNFDAKGCGGVRGFVGENAAYWIREFHLDGLRLDCYPGHT